MTDAPRAAEHEPLFRLRDVTVRFADLTALRVDNLEIATAQATVIQGENGSGKTTLLRVLNGLLTPETGVVQYLGMPLTAQAVAHLRADSVLVHQSPLLFHGTVGRNVAYGARVRGVPPAALGRRVADSLSRVGLTGYDRRRAAQLSGGEKQRVVLARALATGAHILMLDEPTAHMDAPARRAVEQLVKSEVAAGTTVIMTSHDQELTHRCADRILSLCAGQIVASRENVWRGVVAARDDQFVHFRTGPCTLKAPAKQGDFCVAVLPVDDVLLSKEPLVSSARNHFTGRVRAIGREGELLRVTLDCGIEVQTLMTTAAAAELQVEKGREFVVTFKASALRLY